MTLVDTSILVDILSEDPNWLSWSLAALDKQSLAGPLLINEIVYAELGARYTSQQALEVAIGKFDLQFEWLPKSAPYLAGRAFRGYRRSGGLRTSILADFFIGAHADVASIPILTRDARRYRTYFRDVELITPP
jgi:predicted nucleic acid-binding protein